MDPTREKPRLYPLSRSDSTGKLVVQLSQLNTQMEPVTPPYSASSQHSTIFPGIKSAAPAFETSMPTPSSSHSSSASFYFAPNTPGHYRSHSYSSGHANQLQSSVPNAASYTHPASVPSSQLPTPQTKQASHYHHRPRALSHGVFDMFDSFENWQTSRLRTPAPSQSQSSSRPKGNLLASPFGAKGRAGLSFNPTLTSSVSESPQPALDHQRPPLASYSSGPVFSVPQPHTPPEYSESVLGLQAGTSMPQNSYNASPFVTPNHTPGNAQPPSAAPSSASIASATSVASVSTNSSGATPSSKSRRSSVASLNSVSNAKAGAADVTALSNQEIFLLCKDQRGCRSLQRRLQEQSPASVNRIFEATYPHMSTLMMDPFGNYFCQKLVEHCSQDQLAIIVQTIKPSMVDIALNQHGTRALQKTIETLRTREQVDILIEALENHVVRLIRDLNGNHVIQKCLVDLDEKGSQFIYDAVKSSIIEVGSHRHGCCVLQRCIDHASPRNRQELVSKIISHSLDLVRDPFGNYVCQYVIDLKVEEYTVGMSEQLLKSISTLSVQKFSSNVVEKCLWTAPEVQRARIIHQLLDPRTLHRLLLDSYGNYVIQTALDSSRGKELHAVVVEAVQEALTNTRTPYGRRIMSKLRVGE